MSDDVTLEQLESNVKSSRRADKRQKWVLFWLVGITTLLALGLFSLYLDTRGQAEASAEVAVEAQQEKVEVASEARQAICGDKGQEIYDRELCEKLAGIAEEDPAPLIDRPALVIGGPSQAEIVQGFREYCAEGNCRGPEGAEPTPEDIADAFARYCADGRCTGPAGADAPPAEDGADGAPGLDAPPPSLELMAAAVTQYCAADTCVGPAGAQGPPPTAEAVAAAVASYCSTGACIGATGADGRPGADGLPGSDGPPGRSLIDVECQQVPDYAWIFTYSDGTTETEPGPCRAFSPPPTEPTAPPTLEAP